MPLDPQVGDFLDRLAAANLPPIQEQPVKEARAQMDLSTHFLGPLPRVDRIEDRLIPGPDGSLRVRIITPLGAGTEPRPVLVYFHGGGWVLGNIESHEGVCRALANAAGVTVVSVDYRLAPEHQFPAAVARRVRRLDLGGRFGPGVRGRSQANHRGRRQCRGKPRRGRLPHGPRSPRTERGLPGLDLSDHRLQPGAQVLSAVRRGLLLDPSRDGLVLGPLRQELRRSPASLRLAMPVRPTWAVFLPRL